MLLVIRQVPSYRHLESALSRGPIVSALFAGVLDQTVSYAHLGHRCNRAVKLHGGAQRLLVSGNLLFLC